jgi:hypothetical protein
VKNDFYAGIYVHNESPYRFGTVPLTLFSRILSGVDKASLKNSGRFAFARLFSAFTIAFYRVEKILAKNPLKVLCQPE